MPFTCCSHKSNKKNDKLNNPLQIVHAEPASHTEPMKNIISPYIKMNKYVDENIDKFDKFDIGEIEQSIKHIMCDCNVTARSICRYLQQKYNVIYKQIDSSLKNIGIESGIIHLFLELDLYK